MAHAHMVLKTLIRNYNQVAPAHMVLKHNNK